MNATATVSAKSTMAASRIVGPLRVEIEDAPMPAPGPKEVRVRLEGCGVCASNIPPWEGREWFRYPFAPGQLGHEGWGHVEAVGSDVMHFSVGDRVAFLSEHAYAEYDVAHEDKVVSLPETLANVPFPAEPLGCAMNIFRRCGIEAGQTVAIIGVGFLGAILTNLCAQRNAR